MSNHLQHRKAGGLSVVRHSTGLCLLLVTFVVIGGVTDYGLFALQYFTQPMDWFPILLLTNSKYHQNCQTDVEIGMYCTDCHSADEGCF